MRPGNPSSREESPVFPAASFFPFRYVGSFRRPTTTAFVQDITTTRPTTDEYSFLPLLSFQPLICLLFSLARVDSLFLTLSIRYNHNWFTKWLMNTSGIIDGSSFRAIGHHQPAGCCCRRHPQLRMAISVHHLEYVKAPCYLPLLSRTCAVLPLRDGVAFLSVCLGPRFRELAARSMYLPNG